MTQRFGDRTTFAVEVGQSMSADLRVVDLWAAGKWLTTDDSVVFLPSFLRCLLLSAAQVRRRDLQPSSFPDRAPAEIFTLLKRTRRTFENSSGS